MEEIATVMTASGATWQEVATSRQKHRDATIAVIQPPIPSTFGILSLNVTGIPKQILTAREVELTESPVEKLILVLANGTLSSTELTKAFLRRAGLAQKLRALDRAAFCDAYLEEHKTPIGPLHGLPISVKEHIGMKGLDLNAAFISWVGKVAKDDALLLKLLWNAGAVFYVRSTEPQALMHLETSSNIFGITTNPANTTLAPGGSSGGEGALLGLRASCLGIGSDIGGSIRCPAANNGVFGFKPTTHRLPLWGVSAPMLGQEHIVPRLGPLSTSLEGIKLFMKTAIAAKPWRIDPSLVPLPWQDPSAVIPKDKKLKIAFLFDDGFVKPHPPITRALSELKAKLSVDDNFVVVDWNPYNHAEGFAIINGLFFADGGAEEIAAMEASGEPILPLTHAAISENPFVKLYDIPSLWAATLARDAYRGVYAAIWEATASSSTADDAVDVIISPVGPGVATKLGTARYPGYTSQWNLLDYPAVSFPVSTVRETDGVGEPKYEPRHPLDAYMWSHWEEHGAKGYADAPVSLQIIGRRFEDEKVLGALERVIQAAGLPSAV